MAEGTIKRLTDKGFGFIDTGSDKDMFFHSSNVEGVSYDELQEGLAVFAEYLVAGLTEERLRTLAGRVVAARAVSDGSEFIETFRLLTDEYGITTRGAFQIAARVHRGGGFVKDAVYLRGLRRVVEYLGDGGRLDTLLVGKIAADHAPVVEELQRLVEDRLDL